MILPNKQIIILAMPFVFPTLSHIYSYNIRPQTCVTNIKAFKPKTISICCGIYLAIDWYSLRYLSS